MVKQITRDELLDLIGSGKKFVLLDVLPEDSYFRAHIKGAVSLPFAQIDEKTAGIFDKDELIVTYCGSFECPLSTKAAEKLITQGYRNVLDYKGGLKDYHAAGLPMEGSFYPKK